VCRKARPGHRRRSAWLSRRAGIPSRRSANRATAPAWERIRSSFGRARASIQVAEFVLVRRRRSNTPQGGIARLARKWTTSSSSQDVPGELLRANAAKGAEEGTLDRDKPLFSRGAVEAISILRSSRKLSCNGGGVTRRMTGCQRRSRVRSEMRAFPGASPLERLTPVNTRPRCRTARRSGSRAS
jgi:hypothetical protein